MGYMIDPFLYNVKSIDLHGYDASSGKAKCKMFIDEIIRYGDKQCIIVHGKGSGVLRKAVHEYLKSDKRVQGFKTNYNNDGETIVNLK